MVAIRVWVEQIRIRLVLALLNVFLVFFAAVNSYVHVPDIVKVSHGNLTLINPPDYTFFIWRVVYSFVIVYVCSEATRCFLENVRIVKDPASQYLFIEKNAGLKAVPAGYISFLITISSISNITWVYLWSANWIVSTLIPICVLWTSLLLAYIEVITEIRPLILLSPIAYDLKVAYSSTLYLDYLLRRLPISLYFGWICIIFLVNVFAISNKLGFTVSIWVYLFFLGLAATVVITLLVLLSEACLSFVCLWTLVGVIDQASQLGHRSIVASSTASLVAIASSMLGFLVLFFIRGSSRNIKRATHYDEPD